jgi:glycosyltransferase involved in cell wall biosynthesis
MPPRVTIITATYNWSTVLPFSIGSVLDQSFTDFEHLVVGDGCTDDSERVVREINDPRVRWINLLPRWGHQTGPNNEGLRQARGEYIAYLGHDDLWLPHHLQGIVAALDAGADFAYSAIAVVLPDGKRIPLTMAPSGVAHRRSLFDVIGPWRDHRELVTAPDADFFERARDAGAKFAYVPRLSVVKIAAALRRDVYKERPCHEQEYWLNRIRTEPDLEATEMGHMIETLVLMRSPTTRTKLLRLLVRPWRWPGVVWRRIFPPKGKGIRYSMRFRGIVD